MIRNQASKRESLRHDRKQALSWEHIFLQSPKVDVIYQTPVSAFSLLFTFISGLWYETWNFSVRSWVTVMYSRKMKPFSQKQVGKTLLEGNYPFNCHLFSTLMVFNSEL